MTARPSPSPSAPRDTDRDADAARLERHKRVLMILVEVGMAIVRVIRKALEGHGSGRLAGELPLGTFCLLINIQARVSRLVRLALILLDRLYFPETYGPQDCGPQDNGDAGAVTEKRAPETAPPEQSGRLEAAESLERPMRPEFSQAFLNRSMEDLIGLICKGLGLDPAWLESAIAPEAAPDFVQAGEACLNVLARRARWGLRERVRHSPALDLRHLASRLVPAGASP